MLSLYLHLSVIVTSLTSFAALHPETNTDQTTQPRTLKATEDAESITGGPVHSNSKTSTFGMKSLTVLSLT